MNKQMLVIMALLVTTFLGFGIIIPVLPEIVAPTHLGWMLALYSAVSFFMSPVWGRISDRIGRRPVLMIGILGFSVSFFIFAISLDQLFWMYFSRLLGGFFSGAVTSCAVAYVADITTEDERTKGMGLVGMSIGLGFIFGPAIGGILSVVNLAFPFYISSVLALFTFIFVFSFLTESLTVQQREARMREKQPSRWTAFRGKLKYLYLLGFVVSFTLAGLEGTLQYFQSARIGAGPFEIGIMFLISGIVGALIQGGVVRRYIRKGQETIYIGAGLVLSAMGFILLLFSNSFVNAALFLSVFAAGNALVRPCVTSLITQKTTVGQGVATGLSSSMDSLGRVAGPLFGVTLFQWNAALPYLIGGIICLASLGFLIRFAALDKETLRAH